MTAQPLDHTHEVFNQPAPLEDYDLFGGHPALAEATAREGAGWAIRELAARGLELGRASMLERGQLANRNVPILRAFDRHGRRRDEVEFHPAWHELLAWAKAAGLDSGPWADPKPGAHVARAALFHMYATVDNGTQCPVTMTYGCVPTFRHAPADLAAEWLPRVHSRQYDPRFLPAAAKHGVLLGMGMTEKQGGSDVRSNTTRATPAGGDGEYTLLGHKWFFSAPMCDAFFVLAQAPGGLTCFLLPRFRPDGTLNDIRIQRLKDKLGDRSNAGSEVEFFGAWARRVGEEGRGVPIILEMGTYTRLDCAVGTAGIMRHAVAEAVHHACGREAFGRRLAEQPLMQNVLADLALESEAATALALRLARAFDAGDDEAESLFRRIVTPAAKFWICKRGPAVAAEAMEVLGGNGYVEEGMLARIYRQMPLNSIWEGSGNIMCLDVLRAARRHPRSLEVLATELAAANGRNRHYDAFVARLMRGFGDAERLEERGRRIAQELALAVQGSLLLRHAPGFVADAFCESRLAGDWGQAFGTLPASTAFADIINRAWPAARAQRQA